MEQPEPDPLESFGFFDPEGSIEATRHGKLPHWSQSHAHAFVTWRLGDALPTAAIESIKEDRIAWLRINPKPWSYDQEVEHARLFSQRLDDLLDAGSGCCLLREPAAAGIVGGALRHFDDKRYLLDSYVVMPNHVHVLVGLTPEFHLQQIVHSWKSYTSNELRPFKSAVGPVWQDGYRDRLLRNSRHLRACRVYISENPDRAKLREGEYERWRRNPPESE